MKQMDIEKIEKEEQGPILEPEQEEPKQEESKTEEPSEETREESKQEEPQKGESQTEEATEETKEPEESKAEGPEKKEIKFEPPKPPESPKPPQKSGHGSFLPYFLGLLLGLIVVFGFIEGRAYLAKRKVEEITPQETQETNTQETATTETPAQTTTPTEQTQPAAPVLDKATVSIQVLNGSGVTGEAAKIKDVLEKDGFKVASVGNASSFTYQTTKVYYKTGKKDAADAVVQTLKNAGREARAEEKTALTKYDVQVVVGKK